jgi:hypothetical protein
MKKNKLIFYVDTKDEHFKGIVDRSHFYSNIVPKGKFKCWDWFIVILDDSTYMYNNAPATIKTEIYIKFNSKWKPLSRTYGMKNPLK